MVHSLAKNMEDMCVSHRLLHFKFMLMSMFMNYTDIRTKLEQQLKCLENKMEGQCAMVLEVQEFFRKRAEVEQEYSAKLDKLAKAFQAKQKTEQQRK